ncbi:MAG: ABC transporter substrate-binding protein, partial [Elusimicrobiota bacterium]
PIVTSMAWAAAQKDWDGTEGTWASFNARPLEQTGLHARMNGTGPFRLDRAGDDELVLARHEGYWRRPSALERVRFRVVASGGLRLFMLQAGDADSGYLEESFRPYASAAKSLRVIGDLPDDDIGDMLFFNLKIETLDNELVGSGRLDGAGIPSDFFNDIEVRRGFAWSFDYEQFARSAFLAGARRVRSPFPPSMSPGAGGAPYVKDLKKAREAFQKAFGGELWSKGFVLPVAYSINNLNRELAAEALRNGLKEVNPRFKVQLHPLPSREYYAALEGRKLPLFINGYFADYPDPHAYAFGLLQSQSYHPKYQSFSNPEIDALIETASVEADAAKRKAMYQRLAVLAEAALPHLYTYAAAPLRVCGASVTGCDSRDNTNNLAANNFPYFYSYSKTQSR